MHASISIATRVSLTIFSGLLLAQPVQPIAGQWMIDPLPVGGQVQLTLHRASGSHNSTNSAAIPLSGLRGLTAAQMNGGGSNLRFEIVREAGHLACEGYFKGGQGAGAFTFNPNPSFAAEMRSLGYDSLSPDEVFSMASHDVGPGYVREMRSLGVAIPSSHQLIAMRIHKVTPGYVRSLRDLGYSGLGADRLVAMRIHGVTPEYIQQLQGRGMRNLSIDQLVSLRIHGITE